MPEVICGNTEKDVVFLQNKRKPAATRNQNTKIHKQQNKKTNSSIHKQNNQNLGKQTQPSCVNNGSMYNRVKSMEYRFLWEEGICSKGNVQFEIEVGYR